MPKAHSSNILNRKLFVFCILSLLIIMLVTFIGAAEQDEPTSTRTEGRAAALKYLGTGAELERAGDMEGAISHYQGALRADPSYADGHLFLGLALTKIGRHKEAIDSLKKAVELNPDQPTFRLLLGHAYARSGLYDEAVRSYRQALIMKPDYAIVYMYLGQVLEEAGQTSQAMEEYNKFLQLWKGDERYTEIVKRKIGR
jgi:Flp pilus assembly protein TadD